MSPMCNFYIFNVTSTTMFIFKLFENVVYVYQNIVYVLKGLTLNRDAYYAYVFMMKNLFSELKIQCIIFNIIDFINFIKIRFLLKKLV